MKLKLTVEELHLAETSIILRVQKKCFPQYFISSETTGGHEKTLKQGQLYRIEPMQSSDGVLRDGGTVTVAPSHLAKGASRREMHHPAFSQ